MSHEPALSTYQSEFWDESSSVDMLDDVDEPDVSQRSTTRKSMWLLALGVVVVVALVAAAFVNNNRPSPIAQKNEIIASQTEMRSPIIKADYTPPQCVAGQYVSSGKCNTCPAGYKCDGTSKTICDPGTYQVDPGQSACKQADCGYFAASPGSTTQEQCRAGTYSAAGASRCTPADPGFFAKLGACSQTKCPVGSYQDCEGQAECPKGPCGHYVPTDGSPGFHKCPVGTYQDKEAQKDCISTVPGTWAGEGFCHPMACTPGNYQDLPKQGGCKKAPCGKFVQSAGATGATDCLVGTYQPLEGEPTCLDLPSGYISDQQGCGKKCCPAGQYRDSNFVCVDAPCGHFVKDPCAIKPTKCDPGFFSAAGATACTPAPKGSIPNQSQCGTTKCPPGQYQDQMGQATCKPAECGHIAPGDGTVNPDPCPMGWYQDMPSKTQCIKCPAGTYQGSTGQCGCNKCAMGTFNPDLGQSKCTDAPCGKFVNTKGAKEATPCPAGTFQANVASTGCDDAPPGQYAPGGTCDTTPCKPGTFTEKAGMSKCTDAPCGHVVASAGLPVATPCPAGQYQPLTGQTACLDAPTGSYTNAAGKCQEDLCVAGTYQPQTGQQMCVDAACGHYVPMMGSADQFPCGPGRYQPLTKQLSCLKAAVGKFVPNPGSCKQEDCPEGSYTDCEGQSACVPAHCGSFVAGTGKTAPKLCPPGQYQDTAGSGGCKDARPGTFSAGGMCSPQECDPGTYQGQSGQLTCKSASCGNFVEGEGAISQVPCSSGSYQPASGSTGCLPTTMVLAPNPGTCDAGATCFAAGFEGVNKLDCPKLNGPSGALESFSVTNGGGQKTMSLCMGRACKSTVAPTIGQVLFGNGLFLDSETHCGAGGIPVFVDTTSAGCAALGGTYVAPNCQKLALCANGRYYFFPTNKNNSCMWWGIFYLPEDKCLAMGGWINANSVPGSTMVFCHFHICKK